MEKRENKLTELVFILDRSGSMAGLESDTIGGFNSVIEKQRKQNSEALVTTVLFDNEIETLHDRIPLSKIKKLNGNDYFVRGCTALIDAIGSTVEHVSKIHKYARNEDVPANTMFVIITDGCENASHKYSSSDVKKMIEAKKEIGWEFLFIGANIDAVETASHFGISEERAVNYRADKKGTKAVYKSVSAAVECACCAAPLAADWRCDIDEDYKNNR